MEYKIIKEFPNYEINENCQIRSIKSGRFIKPYLQKGYYRVSLTIEKGKQKSAAVHRLLASAFIPNLDNKPIIDHINQDKTDNRIENLRWSTYKENANNVDPIKRKHKSYSERIKFKYGLIFCEENKKWIVKNKEEKILYDNIEDAFSKLKDIF